MSASLPIPRRAITTFSKDVQIYCGFAQPVLGRVSTLGEAFNRFENLALGGKWESFAKEIQSEMAFSEEFASRTGITGITISLSGRYRQMRASMRGGREVQVSAYGVIQPGAEILADQIAKEIITVASKKETAPQQGDLFSEAA